VNNNVTQQVVQQVQQVQQVLQQNTAADNAPPAVGVVSVAPQVSATDNFQVIDESLHIAYHTPGVPYAGSVAGISSQYINITPTNLNVDALTPGAFIKTGAGNDYLQAFAGRNILDGGAGSNIFTSGVGTDTMSMDAAKPTQNSWIDLIKNFHQGDDAIVNGIQPNGFVITTNDIVTAGGPALVIEATQATGGAANAAAGIAQNGPDAQGHTLLEIAGYSRADLDSGKLSLTFTNDVTNNNTPYMLVHANG
jgi:Ca2+-binding RTX toxin-like protein